MKTRTFPADIRPAVVGLHQLFRRAGRGAMARTARALGLHRTFYSQRTHRQRFDLGAFLATLRQLDTSPVEFFYQLEGGDFGGLPVPDLVKEQPTPETRRAVRLAYRRMRTELEGVDLVAELEFENDIAEISTASSSTLGTEWLEDLDSRRLDEPDVVAADLAAGLERVDPAKLPMALGVWSSALRLMINLETAAYLNRSAVRLAQSADDSWAVADLYIRRSYIVADVGDHRRALILAELATGIFDRLGTDVDRGRALEDCGRWLAYLGRYRESIVARQRALDLLPETLPRVRFAAIQGLIFVYLQLGHLDTAAEYAKLAEPLARPDPWRAKLLWMQARIARASGELGAAERCLRRVVDLFRGIHLGEAALAVVELVEVFHERGKFGEAQQACKSIHPLLEPLEANPIIGAAIGELLTASFRGSLSANLCRRIRARIEDARAGDAKARRAWRALATS